MFRVRNFLASAVLLSVTAIFLAHPPQALAFVKEDGHWTFNRTVVMHLSLGGPQQLQDGFASFNESAADALRIWNENLSHMQFKAAIDSLTPADGDSDNSAFFSNTVYGESFGRNVLAITLINSRTDFTETDVLFNNAKLWDSYRGPLQGGANEFHRVALHEFGHVVGLDHPDDFGQKVSAVMNSVISDIDSLTADDIAGGHSIYDGGPARLAINPSTNLTNISTRAEVGVGDNVLIGGFIIQGSQSASVILRGIGHSLAGVGLSDALTDPQIELRNSSGTLLAQNDDWVDSADAQTIANYGLDPASPRFTGR